VGKRATKTGDEAGVTKQEQRIVLADDFYLYDTPGMLWPKIVVPESGYHLAASGAVGRNAYDEEEVALELLKALKQPYAAFLEARYKWGWTPEAVASLKEDELLNAIGRKRGALMPGGRINTQKAAESLLTDFRTGVLGRMTLETPEAYTGWLRLATQAQAELDARRKAQRRPSREPVHANRVRCIGPQQVACHMPRGAWQSCAGGLGCAIP
jgi:ribosome biogenesis GTPase A